MFGKTAHGSVPECGRLLASDPLDGCWGRGEQWRGRKQGGPDGQRGEGLMIRGEALMVGGGRPDGQGPKFISKTHNLKEQLLTVVKIQL